MTATVVDASVVAIYMLREEGWHRAREILATRPYTVKLALKEVANAIWKRATLLRDVSREEAVTGAGSRGA